MKKKFILFLFIVVVIVVTGGFIYSKDVRMINLYFKKIEPYQSFIDADQDGIDDQSDILKNAIQYVSTRPQYESKYYDTGYPDDGYGVCTDVVAYALKNSGYDLQLLVDQDRRMHPERYEEEVIDPKIDFRRVRNLKIYFDHHAYALPTTFDDLTTWQGGDIVVYQNHIGIVSNRRNIHGIPYIIHHYGKMQIKYETDTIDDGEIKGHYRIS